MLSFRFILVAAALIAHAAASAFDLRLPDPRLSLSVPDVPAIPLREQPAAPADGQRLLVGSDATYSVQLALHRQPEAVSPRACAAVLLRALVAQPGMPTRENVYRAPLDADTFLVIYALGDKAQMQLHAHILSAAGAMHCADTHFARKAAPGEDIDQWRKTFSTARVAPAAP